MNAALPSLGGASLGIKNGFLGRVDGPDKFRMGLIVIIPPLPPKQILRVNDILATGTFSMTVGKHKIRSAIVPVRGPFLRIAGVDVPVKTPVGFAIAEHDHEGGFEHFAHRNLDNARDVDIPAQPQLASGPGLRKPQSL